MTKKHSNTKEASDPLAIPEEPLDPVAEERARCAEIARVVGMRPEAYADRVGADAVGDAIARHIESGLSMAHITGNFDNAA